MKTRTCLRCKGKGFKSTPVAHLGVAGLCYGCDGKGVQKWVTKDQINGASDSAWQRHFDRIEREGKELAVLVAFYEVFQSWRPEDPSKPIEKRLSRRLRSRLRDAKKGLEDCRKRLTGSKQSQRAEKPVTHGEWRAV